MVKRTLPPVTIGIPFYNAEATLLDAVRSVFAQTHRDWELILLDDGSTDRSLELARSIHDPRVVVYSDGKNLRLAARLNQIAKLAKHEFIARMDADDMMSPERVEKLLSILADNAQYDLVSCATYSIDSNAALKGSRGEAVILYTFNGILNKSQKFLHAGLIARKSWYDRNQYDELLSVGQDTDLWLRAAKNKDFRAMSVAEPLYMYREEGNVTRKKLLAAYRLERSNLAFYIDGKLNRSRYLSKSLFKSFMVVMMARMGMLGYLLRRRNNKAIEDRLLMKFNEECEKIAATEVPRFERG